MPSSLSIPAAVRTVKTYTVTPRPNPPQAPHRTHLNAWDTAMLSSHYIQKGLLFSNPPADEQTVIERLKSSLEEALFHFYPLAGNLRSVRCEGGGGGGGVMCYVESGYDGQGAEFVHAVADRIGVADVLASDGQDIPKFVKQFFPLDLKVNFDGCTNPLLSVQVTVLTDGIFIGCVFNHVVGDGVAYWMFFNAWAEIARCKAAGKEVAVLSRPPVHNKWFLKEYGEPPIKLPYSSPSEFVVRFTPPPLRERMFHFSSGSLAKLKARANQECGKGTISTFQALSALMWRCISRARRLSPEKPTTCRMAIQNRARLQPPLSPNYFGNSIYALSPTTTVGELLGNSLGWAALLIHQAVASHTDSAIRDMMHKYMAKPFVYSLNMFDVHSIMIGGSPWFDMYGCDFGWGKPLAARSGNAHKYDGKISAYPGWEGDGSIDLEVCLLAKYMSVLERDEEFLAVVSPHVQLGVMLGTSSK